VAISNLGGGRLEVSVSDEEIREVVDALGGLEKNAHAIIRSSINDALKHGVTGLIGQIKDVLNTRRVGDIREHIKVKQKATDDSLVGVIRIDYQALALFDFKATFRKKSGVTATLIKGAGAENFKHVFRAKMQSGHIGYFEREIYVPKRVPTQGRYAAKIIGPRQRVEGVRLANRRTARRVLRAPGSGTLRQSIKEKFGPSVLIAFEKTPDLANAALEDLGDYFHKRLDSKIAWQLEKLSLPPV
jgi:hypothetical protein